MYSAIVLIAESRSRLLGELSGMLPEGWEIIAHHTTLNMGPCQEPALLGSEQEVVVVGVALDYDLGVLAVKVMTDLQSVNVVKHVTVAIDRAAGAKPVHSNAIKRWQTTEPFRLLGHVMECP